MFWLLCGLSLSLLQPCTVFVLCHLVIFDPRGRWGKGGLSSNSYSFEFTPLFLVHRQIIIGVLLLCGRYLLVYLGAFLRLEYLISLVMGFPPNTPNYGVLLCGSNLLGGYLGGPFLRSEYLISLAMGFFPPNTPNSPPLPRPLGVSHT